MENWPFFCDIFYDNNSVYFTEPIMEEEDEQAKSVKKKEVEAVQQTQEPSMLLL